VVHIVHGMQGQQITYCGLPYAANMPAITWSKPIEQLDAFVKNMCHKCMMEKINE
jgi:hypothetical protein